MGQWRDSPGLQYFTGIHAVIVFIKDPLILKLFQFMKNILFVFLMGAAIVSLLLPACRHELGPLPFGPIDPTDTIVVPPPPPDPVDSSGVPCSPDTVYFQNQILRYSEYFGHQTERTGS
jgi:hypothetical protein